ncbi:MAG: TIGR00153 family protein [Chlamydiales bacterium]
MKKLSEVIAALQQQDQDKISKLVAELCDLEHEADLTKNDIRNHLPRSLFLPIDRSQVLEILALQDDIADKAEDIGNILAMRSLPKMKEMIGLFTKFFEKNLEAFWDARNILKEMGELLESSFGGQEAQKVKKMVESTSFKEHEADVMKRQILKEFFGFADSLKPTDFYLWINLIEEVGSLSHKSESLANHIRMILELK